MGQPNSTKLRSREATLRYSAGLIAKFDDEEVARITVLGMLGQEGAMLDKTPNEALEDLWSWFETVFDDRITIGDIIVYAVLAGFVVGGFIWFTVGIIGFYRQAYRDIFPSRNEGDPPPTRKEIVIRVYRGVVVGLLTVLGVGSIVLIISALNL